MATTTTNLGLTKPATSDNVDITVINTNMDKLDTAVAVIPNSLAIISSGYTHAAIASGQYVYVRNHSSLADGLYQALTAIAANATLSTSNLRSVSGGGLNELRNTLLYREHITCTPANNLSAGQYGYYEVPVTYAKNKNIIATTITLGHPGVAGGYSLNGGYVNTIDFVYVGYYTPRAITAANADFVVDIVYTDFPLTTNSHNETI